jgi:hypothetical protein
MFHVTGSGTVLPMATVRNVNDAFMTTPDEVCLLRVYLSC